MSLLAITYPEPLPLTGPTIVAIGNFDGVHAGHQHLLAQARKIAETHNLPLVALTFEPHPRTILFPGKPLPRLTTPEEKIKLLQNQGAHVAVLPFNKEVAGWTPEMFMESILTNWLHAHTVVVGENFRFGHKGSGDVSLLKAQTTWTTAAVSLWEDEAGVVSSSRLRGH